MYSEINNLSQVDGWIYGGATSSLDRGTWLFAERRTSITSSTALSWRPFSVQLELTLAGEKFLQGGAGGGLFDAVQQPGFPKAGPSLELGGNTASLIQTLS